MSQVRLYPARHTRAAMLGVRGKDMKRRSRSRRILNWEGLASSLLIVSAFLASRFRWFVGTVASHNGAHIPYVLQHGFLIAKQSIRQESEGQRRGDHA